MALICPKCGSKKPEDLKVFADWKTKTCNCFSFYLENAYTIAGVDPHFWHMKLDEFKNKTTDKYPYAITLKYYNNPEKLIEEGRWLWYFSQTPSTGKTFLPLMILKMIVRQGKYRAKFIPFSNLVLATQENPQSLMELLSVDFLFIDGINIEAIKDKTDVLNWLDTLLRKRTSPLIISSRISPDDDSFKQTYLGEIFTRQDSRYIKILLQGKPVEYTISDTYQETFGA